MKDRAHRGREAVERFLNRYEEKGTCVDCGHEGWVWCGHCVSCNGPEAYFILEDLLPSTRMKKLWKKRAGIE